MRDFTYPPTIVLGKTIFRGLAIKSRVFGEENIPRSGGALLASNHIGYLDWLWTQYAALPAKRWVRFMAKKEIFDNKIAGPLMRSYHHIPVDRSAGVGAFREAVRYLAAGELIGTYPEATISRSMEIKELKSGTTRIAAEAGVPVIPIIVWGPQRIYTKDHPKDFTRGKTVDVHVGEPLALDGVDATADTALLKASMESLLEVAIAGYPAAEQPPGSWWLPASHGGSAPTLEEAAQLDKTELAERARRRREKAAAKK